MGRKTEVVIIEAEGRDKGKHFKLTELPASQGERWAMLVLMAMARGGLAIPPDIAQAGMAGLSIVMINSGLRAFGHIAPTELESLMSTMFGCIRFIPDPANRPNIDRPLIEDDIEEIETRSKLRLRVLGLHKDFSTLVAILTSVFATSEAESSPTTSMSQGPSPSLSSPA